MIQCALSASYRTRTCDLQLRRLLLYPTELRMLCITNTSSRERMIKPKVMGPSVPLNQMYPFLIYYNRTAANTDKHAFWTSSHWGWHRHMYTSISVCQLFRPSAGRHWRDRESGPNSDNKFSLPISLFSEIREWRDYHSCGSTIAASPTIPTVPDIYHGIVC